MNRCTTCGCAIATGKEVVYHGKLYHAMCLNSRELVEAVQEEAKKAREAADVIHDMILQGRLNP